MRDNGSNPDCDSACNCILPSRSVKNVNMKKASQSGVASLKAPSRRGLSRSPDRRRSRSSASSRPSPPEILLQQVDHRPQMAGLLDIDLEQVAQIVKRRGGAAEMALLLDRSGLGIALHDDQAAQHRAVFAGHFLPGRFALVRAEPDPAVRNRRREQDAPAVFRHPDIAEPGPALRLDADRGAQIDEIGLEPLGAALLPPVDAARVPVFQRAAQPRVGIESDIVRNEAVVIDKRRIDHVLAPLPRGIPAPRDGGV